MNILTIALHRWSLKIDMNWYMYVKVFYNVWLYKMYV